MKDILYVYAFLPCVHRHSRIYTPLLHMHSHTPHYYIHTCPHTCICLCFKFHSVFTTDAQMYKIMH